MGQYTSYYLYQKYETRGEQEAIPAYPNVYSIDGDGTMLRVVKLNEDPQCGYVPPTPDPQYRWVNIPITQDYVCDDCPTYQTRWIKTSETTCIGEPTPTRKKLVATYSDGTTNEVDCNDNPTLTSGETQPSGYVASAMTSAVIGDCVTTIGNRAFYKCSSLTSCTISSGVTSISDRAFYAAGLTSINIPDSVTSIGAWAFYSGTSLTSCIIGNSVKTISEYAFYAASLTSVNIPNSVTTIGDKAFYGCDLTSCTIGSGVTIIPSSSFEWNKFTSIGVKGSGASLEIPNNVTSIGDSAFWGNNSLTNITIPDSVTTIDDNALGNCRSLTSCTIGTGVTSIGIHVLYHCSGLTSVTVESTTPPTLGANAFDDTNDCPIYVPSQSLDAYKSATNWSTYADRIQAIS